MWGFVYLFIYLFIYLQTYQVITYIVYITVLYFRQLTFYNLLLLVPVSEDQPHISLRITLRFRPSYSCFIVDRWPSFRTSPQSRT